MVVVINIALIIPFISGILLSLANFYVKNSIDKTISFTIKNLIFNKELILGLTVGFVGSCLSWYSLKSLPLWMVIVIINTVSTIGSVFLGIFVLKEFISPLRSIMIILTITFLIGVIAIK